ncbi:MAG TPA: hypothetical protein VG184_08035 [Acidimicrobiales bacterium]|nr:hypothetical protein [Acidimicrobiales bacterium]
MVPDRDSNADRPMKRIIPRPFTLTVSAHLAIVEKDLAPPP